MLTLAEFLDLRLYDLEDKLKWGGLSVDCPKAREHIRRDRKIEKKRWNCNIFNLELLRGRKGGEDAKEFYILNIYYQPRDREEKISLLFNSDFEVFYITMAPGFDLSTQEIDKTKTLRQLIRERLDDYA